MNDIIKEYTKSIGREKRLDLLILGFVVLFFALCLSFAVFLGKTEQRVLSKRTVLDMNDGSVRHVSLIDAKKAREFEAYHQCRYFMDNFFQYDKTDYNTHLNRALWIGDNSVKAVYRELLKNGWYNNIIDGNLHQYVDYKDKDIQIDFSKKPYPVNIHFNIIIEDDQNNQETHSGTVRFVLADCSIDMDHNPNGYEVENMEIVDFK